MIIVPAMHGFNAFRQVDLAAWDSFRIGIGAPTAV